MPATPGNWTLTTPGVTAIESAQSRRAEMGTFRWKSPLTFTACRTSRASSIGVSALTSTTSVRPPTESEASTGTLVPARTASASRTTLLNPWSSKVTA